MTIQYFIRRDPTDILPYLEAICTQADSERDALGFLQEAAYGECIRQRKLLLLLCKDNEKIEYAGHLMFGGIFPQLKVRQISIAPKHRRQGHATTLLRALISQGEQEGYLSIVANVATDLSANAFYEKNGFLTSRLKAGGAVRNRTAATKKGKHFRIQTPKGEEVITFLDSEHPGWEKFFSDSSLSSRQANSVSDDDGIAGISLLTMAASIDQPSRAIVCVQQQHPFS